MDKKTGILLIVFFLLCLIATAASYYRYMILEDVTFNTEGFDSGYEDESNSESE